MSESDKDGPWTWIAGLAVLLLISGSTPYWHAWTGMGNERTAPNIPLGNGVLDFPLPPPVRERSLAPKPRLTELIHGPSTDEAK